MIRRITALAILAGLLACRCWAWRAPIRAAPGDSRVRRAPLPVRDRSARCRAVRRTTARSGTTESRASARVGRVRLPGSRLLALEPSARETASIAPRCPLPPARCASPSSCASRPSPSPGCGGASRSGAPRFHPRLARTVMKAVRALLLGLRVVRRLCELPDGSRYADMSRDWRRARPRAEAPRRPTAVRGSGEPRARGAGAAGARAQSDRSRPRTSPGAPRSSATRR